MNSAAFGAAVPVETAGLVPVPAAEPCSDDGVPEEPCSAEPEEPCELDDAEEAEEPD